MLQVPGESPAVGWSALPVGSRVWVGGHDAEARREIERHLTGMQRRGAGAIDAAFVTPLSVDEAVYFAGKLIGRLLPSGRVWIVHRNEPAGTGWPALRTEMLKIGLLPAGELQLASQFTCAAFARRDEVSSPV